MCLHPGVVRTEMIDKYFEKFRQNYFILPIFIFYPLWLMLTKSSKQGAQTTIHLALMNFDELFKLSGSYFSDCKQGKESIYAQSSNYAEKLWIESEKLIL